MIRRNKLKLVISSIIILLPMLIYFFGGKILPEEISVHWGLDGTADGWMQSSLVFFILPLILLAIHWLCMILSSIIDKGQEQSKKVVEFTFWIMPAISLASCGLIFAVALGYTANIHSFIYVILAAAFIIIGNYMPKTTRNRTMGIKIKWALSNDENWNATHRFAGKLSVLAGFLCLLAIPLPPLAFIFIIPIVILLVAVVPTIYSYRFYKKQLREGKATKEDYENGYIRIVKNKKAAVAVSVILGIVLVIVLSVLMFTGSIETTFDDNALSVKASFWSDLTLNYEDIESVEYREEGVDGVRINGVGSARLLLGVFQNDEFGVYTRYTYTGDQPCAVIKTATRTVVLCAETVEETIEIYERISAEISH